ncbi:hypothetical protein BDN71DRAFT_1436507 [Pleurotus eryngii]|uniref:Uncharacterized protein n=1 Tax=Pleurotus eryngii TaxID=5323 RepID=A0A9P6D9P9_PLEER|nr:hypothetical protein BDN71DRAFT_1436507 [Pleurotus eryngii]
MSALGVPLCCRKFSDLINQSQRRAASTSPSPMVGGLFGADCSILACTPIGDRGWKGSTLHGVGGVGEGRRSKGVCMLLELVCGVRVPVTVSSTPEIGTRSSACEDSRILLDAGMRIGADLVRFRGLCATAPTAGEEFWELLAGKVGNRIGEGRPKPDCSQKKSGTTLRGGTLRGKVRGSEVYCDGRGPKDNYMATFFNNKMDNLNIC